MVVNIYEKERLLINLSESTNSASDLSQLLMPDGAIPRRNRGYAAKWHGLQADLVVDTLLHRVLEGSNNALVVAGHVIRLHHEIG